MTDADKKKRLDQLDQIGARAFHEPFRAALEAIMAEKGLSDEQAARLLGVSRPTVARWRKGSHAPHPDLRGAALAALREAEGAP